VVVSAIVKLRRLPATCVFNSPWSVATECIALAAPSVHSTLWSQILARNRDFCLPHLEGLQSGYCHDVWHETTRMTALPDDKKYCLFVLTESTNVTDRRTDTQTPHDAIGRACLASRDKKTGHLASFVCCRSEQ